MFMRKILAVLMLVCALGLFAQIPAGTKSVSILAGEIGDFLDDDDDLLDDEIDYSVKLTGGYFLMDALEIDAILGLGGSTAEDSDMELLLGIGAQYHLPMSPMLGVYVGAAFEYWTTGDGLMDVPIDLGAEIFLTPNNAVKLGGQFTLGLSDGMGNDLSIVLGTVHYIP
jgi:hypothetical protein